MTQFRMEIDRLRDRLLDMAVAASVALNKSIQSVYTRDADLAAEVIEGDAGLNAMERELDQVCLKLIALDQPVAGDLRMVLGAMRMVVDLERIGDEAVIIAERALILHERPPYTLSPLFDTLCAMARQYMEGAISALRDLDLARAVELCEVIMGPVDVNRRLNLELTESMIAESRRVERAIQVVHISNKLRRSCELCMNLAESVIFVSQGESVKHLYTDRVRV